MTPHWTAALAIALLMAGCASAPATPEEPETPRTSAGREQAGMEWTAASCDDTIFQLPVPTSLVAPLLPPGYSAAEVVQGLTLPTVAESRCDGVALDNATPPIDDVRQARLEVPADGPHGLASFVVDWVVSDATVRARLLGLGFAVGDGTVDRSDGQTLEDGNAGGRISIASASGTWGSVTWIASDVDVQNPSDWPVAQQQAGLDLVLDIRYVDTLAGSLPHNGCVVEPVGASMQSVFGPAPRTGCIVFGARDSAVTYGFRSSPAA